MVLQSQTVAEVDSCRFLLQGQAKNLADRLFGPNGPPLGSDFNPVPPADRTRDAPLLTGCSPEPAMLPLHTFPGRKDSLLSS